jgi:glutathione S-transferase
MLELFHYPFSTSSQKVRLVLAEKKIPWQDNIIDLMSGEQQSELFLALNPKGEVPVIKNGDLVLSESWLISEYLEETYPHHPLMPPHPVLRYNIRKWEKWLEQTIHRPSGILSYLIFAREQFVSLPDDIRNGLLARIIDPQTRRWRIDIIENGYDSLEIAPSVQAYKNLFIAIENRLENSNAWLFGDTISLADICTLPYVMRAEHLGFDDLMKLQDFPKMRAWYLRMLTRESTYLSFTRYVDPVLQESMMQLAMLAQPRLQQYMN